MKILAIRLAEVGRFTSPVALEGLSGGLDVLAGPNELGKSTILSALDAVLNLRYKADTGILRRLESYGGGAPTIEIDFETAGRRYRLRKTFIKRKAAELRDLDGGAPARNDDAERRLDELLARPRSIGALGLVWVTQGASTAKFEVEDDALVPLQTFVMDSVEASADGGALQRLRRRVRLAIEALETAKNATPRGAYKEAIQAERSLAAELDAATARLDAARARLDRLDALSAEIAKLTGPVAAAQRQQQVAETQKALAGARQAFDEAQRAALQELASRDAAALATNRLDALRAKLKRRAELEHSASATENEIAKRASQVDAARADVEAARRACDALRNKLAALADEVSRAKAAVLAERWARAAALTARLAQIDAQLAACGATRERLEAARRAEATMHATRARLDAAAPRVRIEYDPGGDGRVTLGGVALAGGAEIVAREAIAIEIAGIGRILVTPPAAEPGLLAQLAAAESGRDRQLAAAGASTVKEIEDAVEVRVGLEAERHRVAAELQAIAPKGPAQPGGNEEASRAQGHLLLRPLEAIEADHESVARDLRQQEGALTHAERTLSELLRLDAAARATLQQQERARAEIDEELAPLEPCDARLAALQDEAHTLAQRHGEHARALTAWRAVAPDQAKLAALERAAGSAISAQDAARSQAQRLGEEARQIEGALGRDQEEDIESVVSSLTDRHAAARARRDDFAAEVAALRLLDREFAAAEDGEMGRLLSPVLERIAPHLRRLFPDATIALERSYAASDVTRNGVSEPIDRLSMGTREQVAILARLGFARLLADRGASVPLVLDDALVFADDQRIAAMFDCLAEAARHHQVIVLTCRETAFGTLPGRRLSLVPWRRAAVWDASHLAAAVTTT